MLKGSIGLLFVFLLKNQNMMKKLQLLIIAFNLGFSVMAKDYHVAKTGNDSNTGTSESPFLTIQAAANVAQAGDDSVDFAAVGNRHVPTR